METSSITETTEYTISEATGGKVFKKEIDELIDTMSLVVFGFCRITTEFVVPVEIKILCQSYYTIEFEKWNVSASSMDFRINGPFIAKPWNNGLWGTVVGTKVIGQHMVNNWKIKCIEKPKGIWIGIVPLIESFASKFRKETSSKFRCTLCSKLFSEEIYVVKHLRNEHPLRFLMDGYGVNLCKGTKCHNNAETSKGV